ncbi:hypothetical protein GCM10017687_63370 [Streptomyces echinatus]
MPFYPERFAGKHPLRDALVTPYGQTARGPPWATAPSRRAWIGPHCYGTDAGAGRSRVDRPAACYTHTLAPAKRERGPDTLMLTTHGHTTVLKGHTWAVGPHRARRLGLAWERVLDQDTYPSAASFPRVMPFLAPENDDPTWYERRPRDRSNRDKDRATALVPATPRRVCDGPCAWKLLLLCPARRPWNLASPCPGH